jgi:hypothetical protein
MAVVRRDRSQVLFHKLLFDEFYMPALSHATTEALTAAGDGGAVDVNVNHQCPLSLAIIAFLRSQAVHKQVIRVLSQQSLSGLGGRRATVSCENYGVLFQL